MKITLAMKEESRFPKTVLTSQALASLYVVRQYIASSIGK